MSDRARPVGRSELTARRLFAIGAGLVATLLGALAPLLALQRGTAPTDPRDLWMLVVLAVIAATGAVAPWASARTIRVMSGVAAAGWALTQAAVLVQSATSSPSLTPWLLTASGAAVVSAVLAGGMAAAWTLLGVSAVLTVAHRILLGDVTLAGWANDTQALVTGVVIGFIGVLVLDTSRRLDDAVEDRAAAVAEGSAEHGRLAARTRAAAVVHDEVLATLTLAASTLPVPRDRLAQQARRAAVQMRELALGFVAAGRGALSSEIASAVRTHAPDAELVVAGEASPSLPSDAEQALVAAVRQALENSVRHAGPGARRRVVLEQRADGVRLIVADDGAGFDPGAVPSTRLGIRTSILQRVRDAGGTAVVSAHPGRGTRVLLEWSPSSVEASGRIEVRGDPRLLRRGVRVTAIVFVVTQLLLAVLATAGAAVWWVPLAVCAVIFAAIDVLRTRPTPVPRVGRVVVVVALVLSAVVLGGVAVPFAFGDLWFATAAAFVLIALAVGGRPLAAVIGVVLLVAVLTVLGLVAGVAPGMVILVSGRPVILVALAVALAAVVSRMRRRTQALNERTIASVEKAAWDAAARAELGERVAHVAALAGPLLERIATGEPLADDERRACLAVEGRLRDELRAGRLVSDALAAAAARARERGVDVVLLDDSDSRDEPDVESIAAWMATAVDGARERVVGRLLPGGRAVAASVIVDGRTTDFGG